MDDITFYLEQGIERVILGTAAIKDPDLLKAAIKNMANILRLVWIVRMVWSVVQAG